MELCNVAKKTIVIMRSCKGYYFTTPNRCLWPRASVYCWWYLQHAPQLAWFGLWMVWALPQRNNQQRRVHLCLAEIYSATHGWFRKRGVGPLHPMHLQCQGRAGSGFGRGAYRVAAYPPFPGKETADWHDYWQCSWPCRQDCRPWISVNSRRREKRNTFWQYEKGWAKIISPWKKFSARWFPWLWSLMGASNGFSRLFRDFAPGTTWIPSIAVEEDTVVHNPCSRVAGSIK